MSSKKTESIEVTRREFLAASGASMITVASGTLSASGNIGETLFTTQSASQRPWYSMMRRCGQINFNERDPIAMDVNAWADYWASLKVDAVLINGGGILAFYPTQVPYHHRSQFLGSRDLFGELAAALEKR